ncbi:hypothetical protein AAG570_005226 [Ranatra chinensis]|uniref:Ras-associating domain-containing protein n=1 Tax=Ranatra chinensis TaxID=642074 RepID=A0ABD0XZU4_9HEMI
MGMKLRYLEGFGSGGSGNNYVLLPNYNDPSENKDNTTEKQEELYFHSEDGGSGHSVVVEKNLRASDLCQLLAVKSRLPKDGGWAIVEHWLDTGLERNLEDHEEVLGVYRETESGVKKYIFRRATTRYDFFSNPEQFFPADMVDLTNCDESVSGISTALEQLLVHSEECPIIFSQAWIQDRNKQIWSKTFLLLKDKKLFMSSKVQVVAKFLRQWKNRENYANLVEDGDHNRLTNFLWDIMPVGQSVRVWRRSRVVPPLLGPVSRSADRQSPLDRRPGPTSHSRLRIVFTQLPHTPSRAMYRIL